MVLFGGGFRYGAAYFNAKEGMAMKEFWSLVQLGFAAVGGWLGYFLGGCDGLLIALVVFVAVDYATGVMCAVADKKLSSDVGFKGICRLYELSHNLHYANSIFMRTISISTF